MIDSLQRRSPVVARLMRRCHFALGLKLPVTSQRAGYMVPAT